MAIDDLLDEAKALEASSDALGSKSGELSGVSPVDLLALAESAARLNKATEKALRSNAKAADAVVNAPAQMQAAVERGFRESLASLNQKEQDLNVQARAIDNRGKRWLYATLACGVLIGAMLIASWLFWFGPEIDKYHSYREAHPTVERESVFGARFYEHEGKQYILFDGEFDLNQVECVDLNCFEMIQ